MVPIVFGKTIYRRPPENLRPGDDYLFQHEYERHLPDVHCHSLKSITVSGPLPISLRRGKELLRLAHPWEKRYESVIRGMPEAIAGLFRRGESFADGLWMTDQWSRNYFHWLTDALPRLLLAQKHGIESPPVIPHFFARIRHISDSLNQLGMRWLPLEPRTAYRFEKLSIFSPLAPTGSPDAENISALRHAFGARTNDLPQPPSSAHGATRIWVSRNKSRRRRVANETELLPLLRKYDFEVVWPEDLSFKQQIEVFSNARIVAGLHGAGLTNMAFMPEGANVVEVRRFGDAHNNSYFALANAAGHKYYYLSAESGRPARFDDDCMVNPAGLEPVLETVSSAE